MANINQTQKFSVSLKTHCHPANLEFWNGDETLYYEEITIKDGKIVQISVSCTYASFNKYLVDELDCSYLTQCYDSIRTIVEHKPEELKNIYNALSEGKVKDFCKELQKDRIEELQGDILKLVF